jgi:hypothetical protein
MHSPGCTPNAQHLIIAWASQMSLRCWVGLHDLIISMTISGELDGLRGSQVPYEAQQFLGLKQYSRTTRPYASFDAKQLIDGNAMRSDLRRWCLRQLESGHDPQLLSWATEYLSANVHIYDAPLPFQSRQWTHRMSHWADADGSFSTIEYHFHHREAVTLYRLNPLYFRHPTKPGFTLSRESVSRYIGQSPTSLKGIVADEWQLNFPNLSDLKLQRVADLNVALRDDSAKTSHKQWSAGLLRRYVLASGLFSTTELEHATVDDLRAVIKRVLTVLASPEERLRCSLTQAEVTTYTPPPTDLYDDVFLDFAWRYGSLLARAWREYVATANPSSMDLD